MIILFFIFVASLQRTTAIQKSMPVLLIDTESILPEAININTNPFHKMSPDSFGDIVSSVENRAESIVIFVEDGFSAEDISSRDAQGTPYVHIRQGFVENKISYIPKVQDPFNKLKQLFPPIESNVVYLSEPVKSFDNFKYYYIFFNDTAYNESRVEKLRRHDSITRIAYYSIRHQTRGPIFGIYTGKRNPNIVMRAAESTPKKQLYTFLEKTRDPMIVSDAARFRLSGVYSTLGRGRLQDAPVVGDQGQNITRRSTTTRLLYSDFELEFDFRYHARSWELSSVVLLEGGEEVGRAHLGVGAPYGYSYYCAEPLVVYDRTRGYREAVVVSEYQVEPFLIISVEPMTKGNNSTTPKNTGPKDRFSRSVNCSPCFTAGILAALAVVGILLGILLYGLATLFDCATNSRYDDANQKPLVIVSEL